jgi:hypothetical protein
MLPRPSPISCGSAKLWRATSRECSPTSFAGISGMLAGYDIGIREMPSWDAIAKALGTTDAIEEIRDQPTDLVREGFGDDKFSEGSTLTRSISSMAAQDDLPMMARPADPSAKSRRQSRTVSP